MLSRQKRWQNSEANEKEFCSLSSRLVLEGMNDEAASKLGLEPCRLGRHDSAGIGDGHEVVGLDRVKGEGEAMIKERSER